MWSEECQRAALHSRASLCTLSLARAASLSNLGGHLGVHVRDEVDDPIGVPPLVVVPAHELDKVGRQRDAGGCVED